MPYQNTVDQTLPKYFAMSQVNILFVTWVRAQKDILAISVPESIRSLEKAMEICEDCINYESVKVRVHRNTIVYDQFRIYYDNFDKTLLFHYIESEIYNIMLQIWIRAQKALFPNIPEIDSHNRFVQEHAFMCCDKQLTND